MERAVIAPQVGKLPWLGLTMGWFAACHAGDTPRVPSAPPLAVAEAPPPGAPKPAEPAGEGPNELEREYADARPLSSFSGEASYYSDVFEGRASASGEPYRARAHVAAHRTLPFGSVLRVTCRETGRTTYVRVIDRGPFGKKSRVLDVSRRAAEELGMIRRGVLPVRVEVVKVGQRG
jgi:rare lipoprotein A